MESQKHLGLRLDEATHEKLMLLSDFEGRSINREVIYPIRQAIREHESKYGELK